LKSIAHTRLIFATDYATLTPRTSDTQFAVCHDATLTCMVTIQGVVEVAAEGKTVTVASGQGTFILANNPPFPPVCVDLAAIQQWLDRLRGAEEVSGALVGFVNTQPPCSALPTPLLAVTQPVTAPAAIPTLAALPTAPLSPVVREWLNPVDGAPYVLIPAGEFIMGTADGPTNERPAHTVYLDEFWIMQTEVTNAQYARCVEADKCTAPANTRWNDPAFANHPVTNVNWQQAVAYAAWAGGRLPTEAEWEKAARGVHGLVYPWGDQAPNLQVLNYNVQTGGTVPVASYPSGASPYGVLDMAGNAEEWVADWYDPNYYPTSPPRNPQGPAQGDLRILRGGSYVQNRAAVRAAVRAPISPNSEFATMGFRVVVSAVTSAE
jgi:formylglycine-generating enzyme required for sulfatase activity